MRRLPVQRAYRFICGRTHRQLTEEIKVIDKNGAITKIRRKTQSVCVSIHTDQQRSWEIQF